MRPFFVFLDRDGVINEFPGVGLYVTDESMMRLIPGSAKAVRALNDAGVPVHVVSNQGCVSRGLVSPERLRSITDRMIEGLAEEGARLDGIHYCVHQTSDRCSCKKPATLLFEKALAGRRADKETVFFVGDSTEDMEAAQALGCRAVLVLSGRTREDAVDALKARPDAIKRDLAEAVRWILEKRS